uniref:Uncharacterized protein n=2 Tax=Salix viminalis TaxID=40686 RepID=A0A6N2JW75_SALVM
MTLNQFLVVKFRIKAMVLDNLITSPHLRSPSFRKQFPRDDLGSWSTLLQRHRFLLTALVLLAFLCTIYLYFAVLQLYQKTLSVQCRLF